MKKNRSDGFDGRKPRALARKSGSKKLKKTQVTRRARRAGRVS